MSATVVSNQITNESATNTLRLYGALVVQHGKPTLFTAAPASMVVQQARADVYDPLTEAGYQREPSPTRVRAAAQYYQQGGRMPNPLLVNVREIDFPRVKVAVTGGDSAAYENAIDNGAEWIGQGYIEFSSGLTFWLKDGQHRDGGIGELVARNDVFNDFPIPLSVTLGLSAFEEMKEFYDVNTNAKSVKTDLAWELLRHMAQEDPQLSEELELSGKDWTSRGIEVARAINALDGPWAGRIQFPNQKRVRADRLTLPQAQFVRSVKPILDMPLLQNADAPLIAQIVNAYWKGIAQVLPELFHSSSSPKDWVIQKGPGAISLHRVLPRVIEIVRSRGRRLGDPKAYGDVMKGLRDLAGEITEESTGDRIPVSGADFWRAGPRGVASAFTGEAGRKRLFLMVQAILPKPSQEITL